MRGSVREQEREQASDQARERGKETKTDRERERGVRKREKAGLDEIPQ